MAAANQNSQKECNLALILVQNRDDAKEQQPKFNDLKLYRT